ncbi:MAG: hypothetical protein IPH06_08740 [Alphaproteobacteria bacterium]|jgi:alginate O-acetyltransferase complex protein AlgI|nr:hypothetical protein [Alphaproteobacteria bacterium]QQS58087.1 MAG: hypothetical protein IPN28_04500 [Alphaproteobacteria bacterium]
MKFNLDYNAANFFVDLLAFSILILPLLWFCRKPVFRHLVFIFGGSYILFFIAPRLAIFYSLYWISIAALQRFVFFCEHRALIRRHDPSAATLSLLVFWLSVIFAFLPMLYWKIDEWALVTFYTLHTNDALFFINRTIWEIDLTRNIYGPIGLSFATFRALDLIIKTYIGVIGKLSFDRVLFYGFFPPVLVVGPIIEYEEIETKGKTAVVPEPDDILVGSFRISWGFFKVLFLTSLLQPSTMILEHYEGQNVLTLWLYLFAYTWYFYFNFSGFSDIAIGLSRIHGYKLKENFNNPFFARNVIEFWSGWHISLYRFARRNIFVPLGGYRRERHLFAVACTMVSIALWHSLSLSMLIYGLYHTIGVIVHRYFSEWRQKRGLNFETPIAQILCIFVTYVFVGFGFPLITLPLGTAFSFYATLLGLH